MVSVTGVIFNDLKHIKMQVKYKAIRERLKKHIEDSNGEGTWNEYYGSQLEADIVRFTENEVKNNDLLHNVKLRYFKVKYYARHLELDVVFIIKGRDFVEAKCEYLMKSDIDDLTFVSEITE